MVDSNSQNTQSAETLLEHESKVADPTVGVPLCDNAKINIRDLSVYYDNKKAVDGVNLDIGKNEVIAMIGPSGCGKSTFLRCLNRMNDTIENCRVEGSIQIDDSEINERKIEVVPLRSRVGMVFQKPNPFPKSIYDNVAYGPKDPWTWHHKRSELDSIVETSLKKSRTCG